MKGILAIICALYALIWGWQNKEQYGITQVVQAWLGLVVVGIILRVIGMTMAH